MIDQHEIESIEQWALSKIQQGQDVRVLLMIAWLSRFVHTVLAIVSSAAVMTKDGSGYRKRRHMVDARSFSTDLLHRVLVPATFAAEAFAK